VRARFGFLILQFAYLENGWLLTKWHFESDWPPTEIAMPTQFLLKDPQFSQSLVSKLSV
jgi:hypothetical protein